MTNHRKNENKEKYARKEINCCLRFQTKFKQTIATKYILSHLQDVFMVSVHCLHTSANIVPAVCFYIYSHNKK